MVNLVDCSLLSKGTEHDILERKSVSFFNGTKLFSNISKHFAQMFQALARDRLERLNASPSATPMTYFRVYSVLLLVLFVDILWYSFNFLTFCSGDRRVSSFLYSYQYNAFSINI